MPDYVIQPYDVLFFRGNKSFHFGEWRTEGVFPPYPSTFQGFVRSKLLVDAHLIDHNGSLKDAERAKELIGDDEIMGVDITGPYLMDTITQEIYFKTPADLFRKAEDCDTCNSAFPTKMDPLKSDHGIDLCCPNIPDKKLDPFYPPEFISMSEIDDYRLSLEEIKITENELFTTEDRVGIALDTTKLRVNNRVVEQTKFYTTPYNRLRNHVGFYCSLDKTLADGALKLGSESHLVHIRNIATDSIIEQKLRQSRDALMKEIIKTKTFRLILLQHGIFDHGWTPFKQIEAEKNIFEVDGLKLELLFAFIQPPLKISGYSFEKNTKINKQQGISLKPMKHAVPAGAVYMFRISDEATEAAIRTFVEQYDNEKIEKNTLYAKMGFNHVMLGNGYKL